jgi:hypothetical protein
MEKLKQQQQYELAQLDKQLANEKALYSYKNSVDNKAALKAKTQSMVTLGKYDNTSSYDTLGRPMNTTPSKFTGSTYKEAVAYMKSKGVPSASASGIMTMSEWSRRKSSKGSAASNYKTYNAYLAATVEYYTGKYGK